MSFKTSVTSKGDNRGIDVIKFVMAIFVVAIHAGPFLSYSRVVNGALTQIIARLAVPFFFVAAGYFFFRKFSVQNGWGALKKYSGHLMSLYVVWTGWYLLSLGVLKQPMPWTTTVWHWYSWLFMGVYGYLWFFLVLLFGVWFWSVAYRFVGRRFHLMLAVSVYIISCIPGVPSPIGAYCFGAGLIGTGLVLAERPAVVAFRWYWLVIAGAYLGEGLVWLFNERYGLNISRDMFWIPAAAALFALGMNWSPAISENLAFKLRKLSTYLYVTHGIAIVWLRHFFPEGNSLIHFCAVLALSMLVSLGIITGMSRWKKRNGSARAQ